ncbi:hypothetical protein J4405_04605 [Candidatus Woesearchaeota archaeon]|nr:hypothetical protein [Candidatus Woesearchaeota archaeon]
MRALISVSDKRGISEFAQSLQDLHYEIISTSGTARFLSEQNIPAISASRAAKPRQ